MNRKIDFGTKQSLTSKSKIFLWDAKGYIGKLIELAPMVCLSPLREWKSKELKLNLLHTIHYMKPRYEYSRDYGSIQNFI